MHTWASSQQAAELLLTHLHSRCARKAASTDSRRGRPRASGRHSKRSVEMMGARLEMVELACRR